MVIKIKAMLFLLIYLLLSFSFCIEYAIIYDDALFDQANTVKDLYNNQIEDDFKLDSEVFSHTYISNNYDGEMSEKTQSFISDLKTQHPNFNYLLILGDENSFPAITAINNAPSDDYFDNYDAPTIAIGRIPSSNPLLVNQFITKLTNFILNPTIGPWRDKAILIADDEYKNGENQACEIKHTTNSDIIYDLLAPFMNVDIMYGVEYDAITTSDGLYHQDLNQDIINQVNNGIALLNYIGHGDQSTLSAEKIIDMERDMNQISVDNNKLGIWVVGTCSFGRYDNDNCMAEELILDEGAAISVISTVRSVSGNYNIDFLEDLFSEYTTHFTSNDVIRIGDIIKNSKNTSYNNSNLYQGHLFHLFGDPALPLFSSNQQIYSEFPQEITVMEQQTIENTGYDLAALNIQFDDFESETLYYGDPTGSCIGELSYTIPGSTIFEDNFTENSCYRIPLDAITCNNCNLQMTLYYQNDNTYNGLSHVAENINLNTDINSIDILDETGPEINFIYQNTELVDNIIIPNNSTINVNLSDESGINLYNGIGHSLRYWFNDENDSYILNTDDFTYEDACSGSGSTAIILPELYNGANTLHFEAWDNFNNRTMHSVLLNLSNTNYDFTIIDKFINFPNPFSDETYFTYQIPNHSHLPIDIIIKIFDLNGKLLKKIDQIGDAGFNSIYWDGKDDNNNLIPNNSYIVNVYVKAENGHTETNNYIISKVK